MRLSVLTACVLFAGATAMAAPAVQTAKPAGAKATAMEKPKMLWASGSIEKFDAATKTLTLKEGGKDVIFMVIDATHVMKGKESLTPAALASGQHAKVEYAMAGMNREAHVIELAAAKAAPAKK